MFEVLIVTSLKAEVFISKRMIKWDLEQLYIYALLQFVFFCEAYFLPAHGNGRVTVFGNYFIV
jgi:hypothetical protein